MTSTGYLGVVSFFVYSFFFGSLRTLLAASLENGGNLTGQREARPHTCINGIICFSAAHDTNSRLFLLGRHHVLLSDIVVVVVAFRHWHCDAPENGSPVSTRDREREQGALDS